MDEKVIHFLPPIARNPVTENRKRIDSQTEIVNRITGYNATHSAPSGRSDVVADPQAEIVRPITGRR